MMFDNFHGMWNYWIFGMFFMLLVAIYVANDASKFGENGLLWALIVFFMPMMGVIFYLIIRSTWSGTQRNNLKTENTTINRTRTVPPREERVTPHYSHENSEAQTKMNQDNLNSPQFCTTCGAQNNANATYCISCGAKIQAA